VNPLQPPWDTAGVPWAGRELPRQPFAGDDGTADPRLADRLEQLAAGRADLAGVVRALSEARLLVPVVAVPGEDHPVPDHARGDLGAELAIVTIIGADGRRSLPVFSSADALLRWRSDARPVPVESARAALAAVTEGCDLLLLDAAGPVTVVVPRPAVRALGQGRPWTPPGTDVALLAALRAAVEPVPDVLGLRLEPLGDAGVRIVLGVTAGLPRPGLDDVLQAVRAALAQVELLPERVDAVELTVLPA
jgi:SseB protein N-terminal domain